MGLLNCSWGHRFFNHLEHYKNFRTIKINSKTFETTHHICGPPQHDQVGAEVLQQPWTLQELQNNLTNQSHHSLNLLTSSTSAGGRGSSATLNWTLQELQNNLKNKSHHSLNLLTSSTSAGGRGSSATLNWTLQELQNNLKNKSHHSLNLLTSSTSAGGRGSSATWNIETFNINRSRYIVKNKIHQVDLFNRC